MKDGASPPCQMPKKHDIQWIMNTVTLLKNSNFVFFQIWRGPQKEVMGHQIWQTWRSGYWTRSATYFLMKENSDLLELENGIKNFKIASSHQHYDALNDRSPGITQGAHIWFDALSLSLCAVVYESVCQLL